MNIAEVITENIPKVEDIKILSPEELKKQDIYKKVQELEEYKYKSEVIDIYLKDVEERINKYQSKLDKVAEIPSIVEGIKQIYIDEIKTDKTKLRQEYNKYKELSQQEKEQFKNKVFKSLNKWRKPDYLKIVFENPEKIKKTLFNIKILFMDSKTINYDNETYNSLDSIFYNYVQAEDIYLKNEAKIKMLNKIKEDIPKLKNKLIVELEKKVISTKMAYIRAIIEYIKSGQFRSEVLMPLFILIVGLLGTDFLADVLKKIGLKQDDAKVLSQVVQDLEKKMNKRKIINKTIHKTINKTTPEEKRQKIVNEMKKIKASRVL